MKRLFAIAAGVVPVCWAVGDLLIAVGEVLVMVGEGVNGAGHRVLAVVTDLGEVAEVLEAELAQHLQDQT